MGKITVEDEAVVCKIEVADDATAKLVEAEDTPELPNRYGLDGKSPYIGSNGNWYTWNQEYKCFIDTGVAASDEELKNRVDNVETAVNEILQKELIKSFDSYLLFPTLGKSNTLYIDSSTNKSYRWEEESLKYYTLNDESFEIINGGN